MMKKYRQVAKNPKSTDKYLATVTATECTVGNKGQRQQVHSELRSISVVRIDHQDSRFEETPSLLTCMFLWTWSSSCQCSRSFRHSPLFPLFPIIESWMKFFFFLLKFIPPLLLLSTDPGESQGHVSRWTGKQQLQDSQDGMGPAGRGN